MTSDIAKRRYIQTNTQTDFLKYCSPSAAALGEDTDFLKYCSPSPAALGEENVVEVPPMGYVDDVLTVSECGNKSVMTNTVTNVFTECKKLKYGSDKCKQIHVGKSNNICPILKVHRETMKIIWEISLQIQQITRKTLKTEVRKDLV